MPPDSIDSIHQSQIRELAHARFDGDFDAAYRTVLEVGLDAIAVPRRPGMATTDGDHDQIRYTETNDRTNAAVYQRFFPPYAEQMYAFGKSNHATMDLSSFCAELETVSRYDGVEHEYAAFSLADWDGHWYGWGFSDLVTALRETDERHRRVNRDSSLPEDGHLLFTVEDVAVLVQYSHDVATNRIQNVALSMYAPGEPFGMRRQLGTIAEHFDGSLGTITEFDAYTRGNHRAPVEPVAYLTEPFPKQDWVSRIVIDLDPPLIEGTHGYYESTLPREVVVNLKHHALLDRARDRRYQIESYAVANLNGAFWNIALKGNWYDVDTEATR